MGRSMWCTVLAAASLAAAPLSAAAPVASVTYDCAGGKAVMAAYYAHHVALKLPDGRALDLPQTLSADGARYADSGEAVVFWSKGRGAFITEHGALTYADCRQTGR